MTSPVNSIQSHDSNERRFSLTSSGTYQGPLAERLRDAIAIATRNGGNLNKDEIREKHNESTLARLRESQGWIRDAWRKRSQFFADGVEISPEKISPKLVQVRTTEQQDLFRLARLSWSLPYSRGYGRRLRFLIMDDYHGKLMGVLGLQSAPIDFSVRDRNITYPEGEKVALVNQTMDIFTLGAVPPYSQLLGGKLVVYAAASQEIPDAYRERYDGRVTQLDGNVLPSNLVMLTTTSAFGRSSIYNRVSYRDKATGVTRPIASSLGYTQGYGSFHLDAIYPELKSFLIRQGIPANVGFGSGPKPVWQNITRTLTMLNIERGGLKHGIQRQAWCVPLAENSWEYLSGQAEAPEYFGTTFGQYANWWKERWLLPRALRGRDRFKYPDISSWRGWQKKEFLDSLVIEPAND